MRSRTTLAASPLRIVLASGFVAIVAAAQAAIVGADIKGACGTGALVGLASLAIQFALAGD